MNTATYCPRCECPSCVAVRRAMTKERAKPIRVPTIGTKERR